MKKELDREGKALRDGGSFGAQEVDLSVIIPHYDSADTLDRLLGTIPQRENLQVIVVDDRSSEAEREKLRALSEKYPHAEFCSNDRERKGAGTCRNIGIERAKGKWLVFADADDYFLPGMYDVLSASFGSSSDIVFFVPESVKLPSGTPGDRHKMFETAVMMYIEDPSFANYIRMKSSIGNTTPVAKMIRASLVRKHRIRYSEILQANDVMFWTKAGYHAGSASAVPEHIYCITDSDGSMTHDMTWENYRIRINEHIRVCRFCVKHYPPEELRYVHAVSINNVAGVLTRGFGVRRAMSVYRKYRKYRVPLFTEETIKLMLFRRGFFRGGHGKRKGSFPRDGV